jgi:hypothetical protein
MPERVTVMLDSDVAKKLRVKQSKNIQDCKCSVSFSRVINDVLRKGLK